MGLSQVIDVNRITNLENRLDVDESIMVTTDDTQTQTIPSLAVTNSQTVGGQLKVTGATNGIITQVDPATNGSWFGVMQDATYYNLAMGRFATGSKAIEIRSYFDALTIRTGRSNLNTNADFNVITNDQVAAGVSAKIQLMARDVINICPQNGGLNTNGIQALLSATGSFPTFKSINTGISNTSLKFASNGIHSKTADDASFQPFYASAFNVGSDMRFKDDVQDFEESALDHVKATKVRKYKLKTDRADDPERIGLIRQESPKQIQGDEDTLDLYQMCSMLWKAVQELSDQVATLKGAAAK